MSFAFNAAPFNQTSNTDTNYIQQKREAKNKTIKRREPSTQVEDLIQKLHNTSNDEQIADFNPISPPQSESVLKTADKEDNNSLLSANLSNIPNMINPNNPNNLNNSNKPNVYEAFSQKGLNNVASDYYQQYIPTYYNKMSENTAGNKELLEKLNYMIHLLEEQQEEKTGHVTEEIILYSFLGVFLIFIIDSFARAGKYVR
jgi:hypothetical protein